MKIRSKHKNHTELTPHIKFMRTCVRGFENIFNIQKYLKHSPLLMRKTVAMLLIIGLNYSGLSAIGDTFSWFNDTHTSSGNVLSAGSLDFSLTNPGEEPTVATFSILNEGSLDFTYNITATSTGELCDLLDVSAVLHGEEKYNGPLQNLNTPEQNFESPQDWQVSFFTSPSTEEKTCDIELVATGRQLNPPIGTGGFIDTEIIKLSLNSTLSFPPPPTPPRIVLNEILPNPTGSDSQDGPLGEWVEIYNLEDRAINIADWYTRDATSAEGNKVVISSSNTSTGGTIITGHGFLVIYYNKPILNNTGDTVRLFDPFNNLIDEHTYDAPVPENKSIARIPDGVGAWIDPIPTPGTPNEADETPETSRQALDTEAPVITIQGNNPAVVKIGTSYVDLGALVTDNVNNNLGITTIGDQINTSATGTHKVLYFATDQAGNVGKATRSVIVYNPNDGEPDLSTYINEEIEEENTKDIPEEDIVTEETSEETTLIISGGGTSSNTEIIDLTEEVDEEATTTDKVIIGEQATSTPETSIEIEGVEIETATSTEDVLYSPPVEEATSTDPIIIEEVGEISTSTDPVIIEESDPTSEENTDEVVIEKEAEAILSHEDEEIVSEKKEVPGVTGDDDPPVGPQLIEDIISPDTFIEKES